MMSTITEELEQNAYMERMYGIMDINLKNFKAKLNERLLVQLSAFFPT